MKKRDNFLSATTISQRSYCEKQLVLDKRYGRTETDIQKQRRERGDEEHLRHHLEAQRYGSYRDPRCFIATELYGPVARETEILRQFRDTCLSRTWWGHILTCAYYETSPLVIRLMKRYPVIRKAIKPFIDMIVKRVA